MARYAIDNPANDTEFIWRGQPGWEWPFEARGKAWILGFALVITFVTAAGAVWWVPAQMLAPGPAAVLLAAVLALITGPPPAVMLTRLIGRFDTPAAPRAYHFAVLRSEIVAPRRAPLIEPGLVRAPLQAAAPVTYPPNHPPRITTRRSHVETVFARQGRWGWRRRARRVGYVTRRRAR